MGYCPVAKRKPAEAGVVDNGRMDAWLIALFLKPFIALVVFGLICLPARLLIRDKMRDGKLKRFLLRPISRN